MNLVLKLFKLQNWRKPSPEEAGEITLLSVSKAAIIGRGIEAS